jgi:DNA-binding phage protein
MDLKPFKSRCTLAGLLLVLAWPAPGRAAGTALRPEKVVGPEACAECHVEEIEVWKRTVHRKTLDTLERRPETAEMLTKLGLGRIKAEPSCQACHYLGKTADDEFQITAGIACESCHGPAADWVKTHGDYGKGITKDTEAAEHRTARLAKAAAAGMIMAADLYTLGTACYTCHIIPDEKIINVGGHVAGSKDFNLLTWSQGEVRHTILHTGNKANPEATPEHRRRLYVIGCILETEFCFRATANATAKATFGLTQARRADAARKQLEKIQALAPTPELAAIVAVAQATGLRLNNAAELLAAAGKISALGRVFTDKVTGEQLAGIDGLLPTPALYQGKPYELAGAAK